MQNANVARIGLWVVGLGALGGFLFSQTNRLRTPEYQHQTNGTEGDIEVREYGAAIAAQVEIEGTRLSAIDRGFTLLADYISGDNTDGRKIAMTTPVIQEGGPEKWTIQFILPERYTLDTVPQPVNPLIALREVPARQVAVIRFRGSSRSDAHFTQKIAELGAYVAQHDLKCADSEPFLAFYDPPWTLPFLRRNEVMVELCPAADRTLDEKETITLKPNTARPKAATKPRLAKKN